MAGRIWGPLCGVLDSWYKYKYDTRIVVVTIPASISILLFIINNNLRWTVTIMHTTERALS